MPCRPGYQCQAGTEDLGAICQPGSYCPGGAYPGQYLCPAGTYTGGKVGLKYQSECMICPVGYYCPQGSESPIAASAGYYIDFPGAPSIDAQKLCPAGTTCSTPGSAST